MAAMKRKIGRKSRKPPLHIVSDFGSKQSGRSRLQSKAGRDHKLRSKGPSSK